MPRARIDSMKLALCSTVASNLIHHVLPLAFVQQANCQNMFLVDSRRFTNPAAVARQQQAPFAVDFGPLGSRLPLRVQGHENSSLGHVTRRQALMRHLSLQLRH
jgi:hypothetical protein